MVACEDTRRTRALLTALGVPAPELVALHARNERERAPRLVERLLGGEDVCLVSDAGTPGVSDPGRALVTAAHAAGVRVEPVAGPSAVAAAVAVSGLVADRFAFLGFLPRGESAIVRLLDEVDPWGVPLVAFEAPGRLPGTLAAVAARTPDRAVVVCRELTKLHEEVVRGEAAAVAARFDRAPRGEIALVLAAVAVERVVEGVDAALAGLRAGGLGAREAARLVAGLTGLPARDLYERAHRRDEGRAGP